MCCLADFLTAFAHCLNANDELVLGGRMLTKTPRRCVCLLFPLSPAFIVLRDWCTLWSKVHTPTLLRLHYVLLPFGVVFTHRLFIFEMPRLPYLCWQFVLGGKRGVCVRLIILQFNRHVFNSNAQWVTLSNNTTHYQYTVAGRYVTFGTSQTAFDEGFSYRYRCPASPHALHHTGGMLANI